MTYESTDLTSTTQTPLIKIETANVEFFGVTKAITIDNTPSMHINNGLLIPCLTRKLFSLSQLTKELNCTVLLNSDG